MSMDRQTIKDTIKQARELIVAGQAALERLDAEKSQSVDAGEGWTPRADDRFILGTPETGTLRRRSMDLTRTLAELRKS